MKNHPRFDLPGEELHKRESQNDGWLHALAVEVVGCAGRVLAVWMFKESHVWALLCLPITGVG